MENLIKPSINKNKMTFKIRSNQQTKKSTLDIDKNTAHDFLEEMRKNLSNPINSSYLKEITNNGKLQELAILLVANWNKPANLQNIKATSFVSDYVNVEVEEETISFKFIATQIGDNKIIYGGDIPTFQELAIRFAQDNAVQEYMQDNMLVDNIDLGSYANSFVEVCLEENDFNGIKDIDKIMAPKLANKKQLEQKEAKKEAAERISAFNFHPNILELNDYHGFYESCKDIERFDFVEFTYSTTYNKIEPYDKTYKPTEYSVSVLIQQDNETKEIGDTAKFLNELAYLLEIPRDTDIEVKFATANNHNNEPIYIFILKNQENYRFFIHECYELSEGDFKEYIKDSPELTELFTPILVLKEKETLEDKIKSSPTTLKNKQKI